MKEYKRICKECGKELFYKSYPAYWLAEKNNALCRNCARKKAAERKCDLSVLLEETPESYYWIGFLMADGNFNNGRISFTLAKKDEEQVLKFAKFIKWAGKIKTTPIYAGISPMHKEAVDKICEKFDLKKNKTYNPPETILNHDNELLKYLLIGFIDGDGNIQQQYKREDCFIRIKIHKSWEKILKEFCEIINYDTSHVRINKKGYAELIISKFAIISELKKISNTLPSIERKWCKINEYHINKNIKSKITKNKAFELFKKDYKNKDISYELKISESYVSNLKKEFYEKGYNKV